MLARKGNKLYTIKEEEKTSFLNRGFDIVNEEGEVVEHSKGATVSMEKYQKALDEINELKSQAGSDDGEKGEKPEEPENEPGTEGKGKGKSK